MATSSRRRLCDGCRQIVTGPCPTCTPQRRAAIDTVRGNSTSRGYGSRWRNVIRPAFLREHPICVLCGKLAEVPDHWPETRASLVARGVDNPDAFDRLRPLCKVCHDIHGLSYKPWAATRINTKVTVVAGPPCAGKNTYVDQHAAHDDEIIDYDEIMATLSGRPLHEHDEAHVEAAHRERDNRISRLLASGNRGWIIATAPRASQRHRFATSVVVLVPSQAVVMARADAHRPPEWRDYIRRWYREYEPDARDAVLNA